MGMPFFLQKKGIMEGSGWGGYFYSEVQRTTTNTLRFAVDRAIRDRSRTIQSDNLI